MEKKLLFSITASDCVWSYTKGTGAGGQKRNKTSSAVHCKHVPSGARGYAEDSRSQLDNKRLAFERMANTAEFKKWHHLEVLKRMGTMTLIDTEVKKQLERVKVEIRVDGIWTEINKNDPLDLGQDES